MKDSKRRGYPVWIIVALAGLVPTLIVAAQDPGDGRPPLLAPSTNGVVSSEGGSGVPAPLGSGESSAAMVDDPFRMRPELRQAQRIIEKIAESKGNSRPPNSPGVALLKKQLRDVVADAFAARQRTLRAELRELQQRTQNLQQSLDTRDQIADQIIDRKVEELLNPNVRWETGLEARKGPNVASKAPQTVADLYRALQGTWLAQEQGREGVIRPYKSNTTLTISGNRYEFREGAAQSYSSGTFTIRNDSRLPETANPWLYMARTYLYGEGSAPGMSDGPGSGSKRPVPGMRLPEPQVERSAVAIDGDTLRICSNGHRGDDRPDDFATKADDGRLLMVYRRISAHAMTTEDLTAVYPGGSSVPGGPSEALPGLPPTDIPDSAKLVTDENRIQGLWKVVSVSSDGDKHSGNPPALTMTFRGNETFTSRSDKPNLFQLDPKQTPSHLTIAGHNMYMQAIYKLDKDRMTVAFFGKPETKRPRSFNPRDAGGDGLPLVVWELERAGVSK